MKRHFTILLLVLCLVVTQFMLARSWRQTERALAIAAEFKKTNEALRAEILHWQNVGYAASIGGFEMGVNHGDIKGFRALVATLDKTFTNVDARIVINPIEDRLRNETKQSWP